MNNHIKNIYIKTDISIPNGLSNLEIWVHIKLNLIITLISVLPKI